MTFETTEEVLNYAIKREIEAIRFYSRLAEIMEKREMRAAMLEMADEEKRHRDCLVALRDGGGFDEIGIKAVQNLKIAEFVAMPPVDPGMNWAQTLAVAMKREQAAFDLYTQLAAAAPSPQLTKVFETLASEEARHKRRFEEEYEGRVLEDV
jgi:rubrerythrin